MNEISQNLKRQLEDNAKLKKQLEERPAGDDEAITRVRAEKDTEIHQIKLNSLQQVRQAEERRAKTEEELQSKLAVVEKELQESKNAHIGLQMDYHESSASAKASEEAIAAYKKEVDDLRASQGSVPAQDHMMKDGLMESLRMKYN